jgi:hypothetical protein
MSSEYISSIVDRVPIPAPDDEDEEENEFEVQRYTHRQGSLDELNDGRTGGELVIDEKPHFDSVSILVLGLGLHLTSASGNTCIAIWNNTGKVRVTGHFQ